ncbi:MAG: hypothetical protein M0Z28_16515 [Rhodospirillales bacterium]|nr:hypothetical protein [Rhodospirillales bacterium]
MQPSEYFPHLALLLKSLRIDGDRLNGRGKVAIDARLLRRIVRAAIERLPFSAEFYLRTYPDIAAAAAAGQIADLHRHYVETGYFEGRLGAPPAIDEAYYMATYPDVAEAIAEGRVTSAIEHFLRSGAAEGRVPNAAAAAEIAGWMDILRVPVMGEP